MMSERTGRKGAVASEPLERLERAGDGSAKTPALQYPVGFLPLAGDFSCAPLATQLCCTLGA